MNENKKSPRQKQQSEIKICIHFLNEIFWQNRYANNNPKSTKPDDNNNDDGFMSWMATRIQLTEQSPNSPKKKKIQIMNEFKPCLYFISNQCFYFISTTNLFITVIICYFL